MNDSLHALLAELRRGGRDTVSFVPPEDAELARYRDWVATACRAASSGESPPEAPSTVPRKAVRKDHNAGGKSDWMEGFWNQPSPPLWQVIDQ